MLMLSLFSHSYIVQDPKSEKMVSFRVGGSISKIKRFSVDIPIGQLIYIIFY